MTSDRFRRLVSASWRSSEVIGASKTAAHSTVASPSSSFGLEWMDISSTLLVGLGGMWRPRSVVVLQLEAGRLADSRYVV